MIYGIGGGRAAPVPLSLYIFLTLDFSLWVMYNQAIL